MKSATCFVVETSQIGRTLVSCGRLGTDELAPSSRRGAEISLLVATNSLFLITGNLSLRLRNRLGIFTFDMSAEPIPGGFPCTFQADQGIAPETSSPHTPPTAIQAAPAETVSNYPDSVREVPAIPRGFGDVGLANPNQRLNVSRTLGSVACAYLCCQVRWFGFALGCPMTVHLSQTSLRRPGP